MNTVWLAAVVAVGAAIGGVLRWLIGLAVNPWWSGFPLGTLAVNAVGGLLVGMAYVWFGKPTAVDAQVSQETLALGHVLGHVLGALCCAYLGTRLMRLWL
jgi:fluoride exporter